MKNRIKFYKFLKVASKVLIGILIALAVLVVAALIFRACTPAENNIAYASEADGIGNWVWNEEVFFIAPFEYNFSFSCNGVDYIGVQCYEPTFGTTSFLYKGINNEITANVYYSEGPVPGGNFWNEDYYRYIDIKSAPPTEFVNMLKEDAKYSGETTPTKYTVTKQAIDCSIIGADTVEAGQTYNYQIAPNTGFGYPNDVEVFGAEKTYNNLTGELTISNVTANVTINARATGAENVVGYWRWDNTLSDFTNAGMIGRRFNVSITADNTNYDAISFSGASSGGTNFDNLFYLRTNNGSTTQTEVYASQMQPKWVERYQTFYLNEVPDNRLLNYLRLNAEYLGTTPQYTISGNVILQSLLTYADSAPTDGALNFTQTIPFTTQDGANWSRITWEYYIDTEYERTIKHRLYFTPTDNSAPVQVWETETGWTNISYRFVNFGNTPVAISKEFNDWATENRIEETGYTIQGKIYFPNTINFTGGNVESELQFKDALGNTFWGMRWVQNTQILQYGQYSENTNGYIGVYSGTNNNTWLFEEYKTIDFGSVPQPVTKAFLDFINAVALTDIDVNDPLYQFGYDAGKIDGIKQGMEDAKDIVTPNSASWNAGYNKGLADAADNTLLDGPKAIFRSVVEILNINIFGIPGFTVGAIVAIVVALGVLLFILKIIRG